MRIIGLVIALTVVFAIMIYFKNDAQVHKSDSDGTRTVNMEQLIEEAKRASEQANQALEQQEQSRQKIETETKP